MKCSINTAFHSDIFPDSGVYPVKQNESGITNPALSQDYNRYSYVRNNPLKYTDPSGYNYTYWNYSTGTYMSSGGAYVDSWGAWNEWFSELEDYRDGFYTTGGQVLGIFSNTFDKGQHSIDVSTAGITKGLYFCIMETPSGRKVVKVVKNE